MSFRDVVVRERYVAIRGRYCLIWRVEAESPALTLVFHELGKGSRDS